MPGNTASRLQAISERGPLSVLLNQNPNIYTEFLSYLEIIKIWQLSVCVGTIATIIISYKEVQVFCVRCDGCESD